MASRARCRGWVVVLTMAISAVGCTCSGEDGLRRSESSTGDRLLKSGYGVPVEEFKLSDEQKRELLRLARTGVETWVRAQKMAEVPADLIARNPTLSAERACFVTLRQEGQLRGCIGSLEPRRPLLEDVLHNAVSAAVHDSRFQPVSERELASLTYSISVLELPRPLQGVSASDLPAYMAKHRPGVILEYRGRRSTFLPSVWEELQDPTDFLSRLCQKQGSPLNCWAESDMRISTYGSIHFSEKDLP